MRTYALACLTLLGCRPAEMVPPTVEVPVDCRVEAAAGQLSGTQGRRLAVPLTLGADVRDVRLTQVVSATDAMTAAGLSVTLPYGVSTADAVLESRCAGVPQSTRLTFSVEPLRWSRAAEWSGAAGPSAREYFSMWLDPRDSNRLLLYGGFVYEPQQFTPSSELWQLSLASRTWAALSPSGLPPTTTGGRLVPDPDGGSALYLGGITETLDGTPYVLKRLTTDTPPAWSDEPTTGQGRGAYQPGFFFDSKRSRYLSLCGLHVDDGYQCELREFIPSPTGGSWRTIATAGETPPGRSGHAFAYDAETDRVVLFGGDAMGRVFGDTWVLDLAPATPRWTLVFDRDLVAVGRRNMAFVLDAENHRLLVWGGTSNGSTSVPGLVALDLSVGAEAWHTVDTMNAPPARTSAAAVIDAPHHRVLMGFGNSSSGVFADLWALEY